VQIYIKIKVVRENKGTIAIYSTYIDGIVLGSAGLTEKTALKEGFEIVCGVVDGVDKHPATLPGTVKSKVKLIFSKQSGIIFRRTSQLWYILCSGYKFNRDCYSKTNVSYRIGNSSDGNSSLFD